MLSYVLEPSRGSDKHQTEVSAKSITKKVVVKCISYCGGEQLSGCEPPEDWSLTKIQDQAF
jgi:hypothetical protein